MHHINFQSKTFACPDILFEVQPRQTSVIRLEFRVREIEAEVQKQTTKMGCIQAYLKKTGYFH